MEEKLMKDVADNVLTHHEAVKHVVDVASISTVIASLVGWLPSVAALLSIVWSVIRIYESQTIQSWLRKKRNDQQSKP